jgi:hypothetical protein
MNSLPEELLTWLLSPIEMAARSGVWAIGLGNARTKMESGDTLSYEMLAFPFKNNYLLELDIYYFFFLF